jgi:diguanylate cyclase (GGDEF)-like protein/PAS domain S-box-containing protein
LRAALLEYLRGAAGVYEHELRVRTAEGATIWTLIRGVASERERTGRVTRMVGTHTDISSLKHAQTALQDSRSFLKFIIDAVPQALFWQDREFRYLGCNQRFAEFAGVAGPAEIVGKTNHELWWSERAARFQIEDRALLAGKVPSLQIETRFERAAGGPTWIDLVKVPMHDAAGNIIGLLGAIHDITVRKEAEDRAQRLALYDPLTSLPNRRYFTERLEASLAAAVRHGSTGALLFIDMDQFKRINDTLGHSVGDELLKTVAARLHKVTRQEDMVARLGGDEFVILLPDLARDFEHCARQARLVAQKIHTSLGEPYEFEHHQFHVTPTIGISLFPEPGKGVEEVLKEADTAMYSGKAAGRNVTRFFRPEMEERALERLRIEGDLRKALERDEFELYFQPQVESDGSVAGAEALVRWRHPTRGLIPPGLFIPVAEERGLIVDIGRWVLTAAFRTFKDWIEHGPIEVGELSINVSSRQFRSESFVADVESLLAEYRIPPHRVVLELTEGTVIEDVHTTVAILERLRRLGILFAVDDFGVGYSSLSYLKRLPIDQLKIDRSFIADIGHDHNAEVICQTIVAMGQHLGLQTVAEGVETADQLEFLRRLRCNRYQGFYFQGPAPAADFARYCAAANPL